MAKGTTEESAEVMQNKAESLYLEKRYSQAKKVLLESIALYPNYVQSHLRLGHIYFFSRKPDYDAAIKQFREVVKLKPSWNEGHQWLGSVLFETGDIDGAIKSYRKSMRLAPEDSRPYVSLGICYTKKERYPEAVKMFKRGLKFKPYCTEADVRVFLAEALVGNDQIQEACAEWRKALQIKSGWPSYGQPQKEAKRMLAKYENISSNKTPK